MRQPTNRKMKSVTYFISRLTFAAMIALMMIAWKNITNTVKIFRHVCLLPICLMGCQFQQESTKPIDLLSSKQVSIKSYHPWQPSLIFKTSGDWALLIEGDMIQIKSSLWSAILGDPALPIPKYLIENDFSRWIRSNDAPQINHVETATLNQKQGIICIQNKCAQIIAICPPFREMSADKKCLTFNIN